MTLLERLGAIDLHRMLLAQAVVPAAVPDREVVRVFLERVGELRTGQLLHVDIAVLIGELSLGLRLRSSGQADKGGCEHDGFDHSLDLPNNAQSCINSDASDSTTAARTRNSCGQRLRD